MKFIVVPNFYIINEQANPPLQLEPFYNYVDAEIVHLKRGNDLNTIPEDDFYGITAYTEDYPMAEIVARFLKRRDPKCRLAIGGCYATYRTAGVSDVFDDVVVGEGDDFIKGLYPRKHNGTEWNSTSFKHFVKYNPNYHRGSDYSYTIRTSYGCYWSCNFCANDKWNHRVCFRDVLDIEKQLEYLASHNVTNIRVIDEIFTSHPDFKQICQMLKHFTWNAQDRIDKLTPEICNVLANNNCQLVQVGVESFNESIRNKLNKRLSDKALKAGLECAKDYGLKLNAFIMLGTPYDTTDIIKYNMDEGIKLFGVGNLRPDIFVPYRGANIGDNPELYNLRILETNPEYYSTFCFQNTKGKLVSIPKHVTDITSWETLLFDTLYELAPQLVKNTLNHPIKDWHTDYEL